MKLTERPYYADKLANVMGTPDIKVITGLRGSEKTTLLNGFIQYVAQNVPDANILHVSFEQEQSEGLKE